MARTDTTGITYLVHFDRPYRHARHYLGWALDLPARLAAHERGDGARLLAVLSAAGIGWHVTRTWPGTTRETERQIKNTRHVPHYCPECQPARAAQRREARRSQRKEPDMTAPPSPPGPRREAGARYDAAVRDVWAGIDPALGTRAAWAKARPGMAAAQLQLNRDLAAAGELAFSDATRMIAVAYAGGADLDAIATAHDDLAAHLDTDAQTGPGRAYASEYASTGRTLIADLRQDEAVARGQSAAACTLPDGTPHPDTALAAKGWQADRGVYVRRQPAADREAC